MPTRRTFLSAAALSLPVIAGCLDTRPGTSAPTAPRRADAPMGSGMGPTSGRRSSDSMPYDPDSMPHAPGSGPGPYGDGMHDGTGPYGPGAGASETSTDDDTLAGWFADVDGYAGVDDRTGRREVRVAVGARGNGGNFAFDAPAIRVSPGTRVVWEWTGEGGYHDVAAVDGSFASDLTGTRGATFAVTFDEAGTYRYVCTPHQSLGMKGAVVVD